MRPPYHFGMGKRSQNPPKKCPDCNSKMGEPLFVGSLGPIIVECTANCGCYFEWRDPWMKRHYLELFDIEHRIARKPRD